LLSPGLQGNYADLRIHGAKNTVTSYSLHLAIVLAVLAWHSPASAQEEEEEAKLDTRRCIPTRLVRRVRVLDDRNVLIYMGPNRIFHNVLEKNCPGLRRVGSFSYTSNSGRLCEGDGIAATAGAFGNVQPTPGCTLGVHTRISRERADAMREFVERGPVIEAAPVPPPEPSPLGGADEDAEEESES